MGPSLATDGTSDDLNPTMSKTDALLGLIESQPQMTVGDLVAQYSERHGVPRYEAARHIHQAWSQENIRLEPVPRKGFVPYLKSVHAIRLWTVISLFILTLISIYILPQSPPYLYLRHLTGTLSVILLPGAALVGILYPRDEDLEPLQRLIYSIGLSLALTTLVGFALNNTEQGVRASTAILSLYVITVGLTLLAVYKRYRAESPQMDDPHLE